MGSDSKVQDIKRFPPYSGLEAAQEKVKFVYCLGRENKTRSEGWEALAPVNNIVGPELRFEGDAPHPPSRTSSTLRKYRFEGFMWHLPRHRNDQMATCQVGRGACISLERVTNADLKHQ